MKMVDSVREEGPISVLNVGTKLLLKDVMEQYIRALGDFKTHYAANMASALRVFSDNNINIIVTEVDLGDASAYRLIQSLGGAGGDDDLYVVLALEERTDSLVALAQEIESHSFLVKPFAAADLKALIERYRTWKQLPKEPWQSSLRNGQVAARDKRFREAEQYYKEAIQVAPAHPEPFYKAALYFMGKPDAGMAEKLFLKAIALKPDYVQAVSSLGSLYLKNGDLKKAEEFLSRAQALSPLNPDRMAEMVKLHVQRSIDCCKSSLRLDPSSTVARFQLGKLMAFQKDYIGTVRELEKALPFLKDGARQEAQTFLALARKLGGLAKT